MLNKNINSLIVMSVLLTTLMSSNNVVNATELSVTDQNRLLGAVPREWESANLREWLNSDKATVNYTAIAPSYKNESGFLSDENFTQSEREAIAITRHSGGLLETLSGNVNNTLYISQRSLAKNSYVYNDKVFILNYTDLVNYIERNKQLMNMNTKYYSNYLQNTTNKKDKYPYIVNTGGVNSVYSNWNNMYSSKIALIYGRNQNNIVPALSLKPDYVLANGVKASNLTAGQTVTFGRYNGEPIEWQVINVSNAGYPLLWSTKIITVKEYDAPGDINPLKSDYINFGSYDVDIVSGTGQNKSWETQQAITSYPVITITNESVLTTPTNDSQITIQIKATDTNNKTIRSITLPDGTVVNGDTASYTITKNGEFDIIAENSEGVITVKHIVTKAINTPAEVTITTDKSNSSKWTNKPVNVTVSATNNGVYTKTTNAKPTGYGAFNISTYPNWMPLGGKRIRVKGTLYNKITDEDVEKYKLDMNATIIFRYIYQKYTTDSLSNTYPQFKKITLKSLKEAGSIEIDEVFTIPNDVYSGFYIQTTLMCDFSNYMRTGYNWGASPFTFEILDKDDLKIEEITMPDGNIVKSDTAKYQVFEAGSYKFSAKDNRGKVTSKTIDIDVDMVNPQADITYNENLTKENVTLQINATDDLSGVKSISLPNGEKRTNNIEGRPLSINYNITENGTYRFTITDFADNQITKTVNVTNIDKTAPTINVAGNPTEWTKNDATLTVTATDAVSGVKSITLPDGRVVNGSSATYTVSANGDYTFRVTDNVGNVLTHVVNVTKIDKTAPTINVEGIPTEWTNQDVTLTIKGKDTGSGVKQITLPNGQIVSGDTATYVAKTYGAYHIFVMDNAGNVAPQTIFIDKIDKEPPIVEVTGNPTSWTNKDVVLTIKATDYKSGIKQIELPDGTIIKGTSATYIAKTYGRHEFKVTDNVGNVQYYSVPVGFLDNSNPRIVIHDNPGQWTNKDVNLKVYAFDSPSGVKTLTFPDGTVIKPIGNPTIYTVSKNGRYTFKAIDNAGNEAIETIDVTKIDKDKPSIIVTGNPTEWTNQDVTLAIAGTDSQSGVRHITLPDGRVVNGTHNIFTGFTTTGFITATGEYRANDPGNAILTDYIEVNSLNFAFRQFKDNGDPVNKYGEFAFYDKDKKFISARVDTNETRDEVVTAPEGTKYIRIWSKMAEGSTGKGMLVYTKEKPSTINHYVPYNLQTYTVSENGDYIFKAIDNAGNETIETVSVTKIDKTKPTLTITGNPTEWTNQDVALNIEVSDTQSGVNFIQLPDGKFLTKGENLFTGFVTTGFITVTGEYRANDPAILSDYIKVNSLNFAFRQFKDNGDPVNKYGEFAFYDKDKKFISARVDTNETRDEIVTAPEGTKYIRIWSKMVEGSTGKGMLVYTKEKPSTINRYIPHGKVLIGDTATYTVGANGEYTFKVFDVVGNVTTKTVNVTKIDKDGATINYTLTPNTWTNGNVTINLNVTDLGAGFKEIHMPNGTIVSTPIASYTVSKNGVYYFKAFDKVGNETILPILVTNIDVKAPSLNINNNQNWTNQNVQIDIAGSDK